MPKLHLKLLDGVSSLVQFWTKQDAEHAHNRTKKKTKSIFYLRKIFIVQIGMLIIILFDFFLA